MGSVALVEAQTYELAPPILQAAGLEIVRVASDRDGVDPEAVAAEVRARGGAGGGAGAVRLLYLVPTHGNPTAATLTSERRARLVALSRELRFYIVADEVYALLGFGAPATPPLSAADGASSVVSVSSVSKILAPGLRVGWAHCSHRWVRERLAETPAAFSGGSPVPALAAAAVAGATREGLTRHLESARASLAERAAALTDALAPLLDGTGAELWPCSGGYFLWLALPAGVEAGAIAARLEEGSPVVIVGTQATTGLRLCFAGLPCDALKVAAGRIGSAVRALCLTGGSPQG